MGLLNKRVEPSLDELHLQAHNRGARALNVFREIADDLSAAADQHAYVAEQAQDEIERLRQLHQAAKDAAETKARKAETIASLIN